MSEIENVLNGFEDIENSVVSVRKNLDGKVSRIIAFVKLKNASKVTESYVKNKLKNILPEYMIPTIKIIEEMPLNSNGKINVKKLLGE